MGGAIALYINAPNFVPFSGVEEVRQQSTVSADDVSPEDLVLMIFVGMSTEDVTGQHIFCLMTEAHAFGNAYAYVGIEQQCQFSAFPGLQEPLPLRKHLSKHERRRQSLCVGD